MDLLIQEQFSGSIFSPIAPETLLFWMGDVPAHENDHSLRYSSAKSKLPKFQQISVTHVLKVAIFEKNYISRIFDVCIQLSMRNARRFCSGPFWNALLAAFWISHRFPPDVSKNGSLICMLEPPNTQGTIYALRPTKKTHNAGIIRSGIKAVYICTTKRHFFRMFPFKNFRIFNRHITPAFYVSTFSNVGRKLFIQSKTPSIGTWFHYSKSLEPAQKISRRERMGSPDHSLNRTVAWRLVHSAHPGTAWTHEAGRAHPGNLDTCPLSCNQTSHSIIIGKTFGPKGNWTPDLLGVSPES